MKILSKSNLKDLLILNIVFVFHLFLVFKTLI
ncbi:hypothetical protein AF77_09185 [Aliarcobacter butzleri L352]|uniref:Uncharacterized protein n=1 Tax=Aliarcobacter butzleri L352 TaxID=1447260 RepID=A0A837JAA9_9BACT|nr:hypothetical protein AF77_09185 [Aliarcobacter butzleri L352]